MVSIFRHNVSRTIVSDGKHIFEIPVADLPAAMADGFFDILTVERELVREFPNQIATPDLENFAPTPAENFPPVEPPDLKFAKSEWSDEASASAGLANGRRHLRRASHTQNASAPSAASERHSTPTSGRAGDQRGRACWRDLHSCRDLAAV